MKKSLPEGTRIPRYYGLAYFDPLCRRVVCYPIPIHIFVQVWRHLVYLWDCFRLRPTWIDKQMQQLQIEQQKNQQKNQQNIKEIERQLTEKVVKIFYDLSKSVKEGE